MSSAFLPAALLMATGAGTEELTSLAAGFRERITSAFHPEDQGLRRGAIERLVYRVTADPWPEDLTDPILESLTVMREPKIALVSVLPARIDHKTFNGYEYRFSLKPLGSVVFSDSAIAFGNGKINALYYGMHPSAGAYAFSIVSRRPLCVCSGSDSSSKAN